MSTTIKELGIDELILIFHKLSWNDIINCCKTCQRWKYIAMNYFIKKQFCIFKKLNPDLEKYVTEKSLKEVQNDEDFILETWEKFQPYKGIMTWNLKYVSMFYKLTFILDKYLVTTGHPYDSGKNPEVLDFSPSLNLSKSSIRKILTSARESRRAGCVGAIFHKTQKIAICGGDNGYVFFPNSWIIGSSGQRVKMLESRSEASGVVLNQKLLWITGGYNNEKQVLHTSEFIHINDSETPIQAPDMPFKAYGHCMVLINSKLIYIIGGKQDNHRSSKTWIVHPVNEENFDFFQTCSMIKPRVGHCCGKMCVNGKLYIVAAGGIDDNSVELLDVISDEGWRQGKL